MKWAPDTPGYSPYTFMDAGKSWEMCSCNGGFGTDRSLYEYSAFAFNPPAYGAYYGILFALKPKIYAKICVKSHGSVRFLNAPAYRI